MAKHFTLIPIGSRGDVQPFVAIGRALKSAGHHVRIATHDLFEGFVAEAGLEFLPIGGDPHHIIDELAPRLTSKNLFVAMPALVEALAAFVTPTLRGVALSCKETDVVIGSYPALYAGVEACEQARIPFLFASLHPVTPSAHLNNLLMPAPPRSLPRPLRHVYNRLSHRAGAALLFRLLRSPVNAARAAQLGWGPSSEPPINKILRRHMPVLNPFSTTLLPPPPDWPAWTHPTGFWFLDADSRFVPPPNLVAFLADGPPPVYVGFGSLGRRADDALRRVVDVLVRRRQRALVAASAQMFGDSLPDHIMPVGALPHGWLFPQLAAAIHHGGIGTTHEALRAGIPMSIVALQPEQTFWGSAAHRLGLGPPPVGVQRMTPTHIDSFLTSVTEGSYRRAAQAAGTAVRAEPGVEQSVALIERLVSA